VYEKEKLKELREKIMLSQKDYLTSRPYFKRKVLIPIGLPIKNIRNKFVKCQEE
jgi:hypothetical protein